ncbi:resolvase [Methylomagnum ishizawai]|nr:resolvase [Methylomagnum ishizawai]
MLAAIYARYSSDRQRETSIEDQGRNCARRAEIEGWSIVARYEDRAISGSKVARAGYQAMLADALAGKFGALLVDDLSRLSRDQVEAERAIRRLEHAGVVIVGVSDGYDSRSAARKIHRGVRSLLNEVYLDDLREKTRRGLEGQARRGNNAGGRCYGYRHVPVEDTTRTDHLGRPLVVAVRREIDPDQGEWIRWIYERYAAGWSPGKIAAILNAKGVPSPRGGTWASSAIYGSPGKTTGILRNPIYAGRYTWNRSEWVHDPDTRKRKRRERSTADLVEVDMPELRIVPDALWRKVQARLARNEARGAAISAGIQARRQGGASVRHLFSGLLFCAECGHPFVTVGNGYYGCSGHKYRGSAVCRTARSVRRKIVEDRLLEHIRQDIPTQEGFEVFARKARQLLQAAAEQAIGSTGQDQAALSELERKIGNIVNAIAAGTFSPALQSALEAAEAQRAEILARIASTQALADQAAHIPDFLPRAVDVYKEVLGNMAVALTAGDVDMARERIRDLVGDRIEIRQGKDCLEAIIEKAGALQLASGLTLVMVAGAGFEPTTFGL